MVTEKPLWSAFGDGKPSPLYLTYSLKQGKKWPLLILQGCIANLHSNAYLLDSPFKVIFSLVLLFAKAWEQPYSSAFHSWWRHGPWWAKQAIKQGVIEWVGGEERREKWWGHKREWGGKIYLKNLAQVIKGKSEICRTGQQARDSRKIWCCCLEFKIHRAQQQARNSGRIFMI